MARFCLASGCGNLVDGRRVTFCEAHFVKPKPWQGTVPRTRGWAWSSIRKRVLKRDGYRCVKCRRPATEVDHILNVAAGGTDDLDNLQSLCSECHQRKTLDEAYRGRSGS